MADFSLEKWILSCCLKSDVAKVNTDHGPDVSVVIPVFNEGAKAEGSIEKFLAGIVDSSVLREVIVVDDGSDPDRAPYIRNQVPDERIRILRQDNSGRYRARETGIRASEGSYILLFDSRVHPHAGSFEFLAKELTHRGDDVVYNARVELPVDTPLVGRFWRSIEKFAWYRYYRSNKILTVLHDEIDKYPIGTTYFGAPRRLFIDALNDLDKSFTGSGDYVSDDTKLIRRLIQGRQIQYHPTFSCTYHPRTQVFPFIKHAFHRGRVFVDGHLHTGSRYFVVWLAALASLVFVPLLIWLSPLLAFGGLFAAAVGVTALSWYCRLSTREYLSLLLYGAPFVCAYASGSIAGVVHRLRNR